MKKIVLMLLAFWCVLGASAGNDEVQVQPIEGGISFGGSFPLGTDGGGTLKFWPSLEVGMRYNFAHNPWDLGLSVRLDGARRGHTDVRSIMFGYEDGRVYNATAYFPYNHIHFMLITSLESNYNFSRGQKVNPFVGLGVGVAFQKQLSDIPEYETPSYVERAVFSPRFGVEFWNQLRVTATVNLSQKNYNNFGLSIGYVIGGRPKK